MDTVSVKVFNSVVKLFVVSCEPNYSQPWQMDEQGHSNSSGFMIANQLILCNAHGVVHARSIRVRKHGDFKKYHAKIVKIDHECDLALLSVDDEFFWKDTKALEFGDVPVEC